MSEEKRFTTEELAKFDGQEGRPAYTAANGFVYDVTESKMWRNGSHVRKHLAGRDLTAELLLAPHPEDRVESQPRVGVLVDGAKREGTESDLPAFARIMYNLHAHPASVHFPIALVTVAALLHVLSYAFGGSVCGSQGAVNFCESAAVVNLYLGVLLSPAPIVSGLVDWKYQFDGALTRLFVWKLSLTFLFLIVGIGAVAVHLFGGPEIVYEALVIALGPMVLALGFIGGRITFPTI